MTKQANELSYPKECRYAKSHEWARADGEVVVVGIGDFAQHQLGDIVFVELPKVGAKFDQGAVFANVESVKAVSECFLPIGGEIVAVNDALQDDPALVNNDCYGAGWFVRVKPAAAAELDGLMDADAYRATLG